MCFLSAKSYAVLCCFASDAINQNKFFLAFSGMRSKVSGMRHGHSFKTQKKGENLTLKGMLHSLGVNTESTWSPLSLNLEWGDSQKHLTGGTWKLSRVVGVSNVRRSQAMTGFVNKQEALEIDSKPHWQPVERSYQRCNMISFSCVCEDPSSSIMDRL